MKHYMAQGEPLSPDGPAAIGCDPVIPTRNINGQAGRRVSHPLSTSVFTAGNKVSYKFHLHFISISSPPSSQPSGRGITPLYSYRISSCTLQATSEHHEGAKHGHEESGRALQIFCGDPRSPEQTQKHLGSKENVSSVSTLAQPPLQGQRPAVPKVVIGRAFRHEVVDAHGA